MRVVLCGLGIAIVRPSAASAVHMDAAVPIYARATPVGFSYGAPHVDDSLRHGLQLIADSKDSIATIDRWYRSNLPKSCGRTPKPAGVEYACKSGALVDIFTYRGQTRLVISPGK